MFGIHTYTRKSVCVCTYVHTCLYVFIIHLTRATAAGFGEFHSFWSAAAFAYLIKRTTTYMVVDLSGMNKNTFGRRKRY